MQLTLTITDGPNLPSTVLAAFIEKAKKRGENPENALADLIRKEAEEKSPTSKKKARAKA